MTVNNKYGHHWTASWRDDFYFAIHPFHVYVKRRNGISNELRKDMPQLQMVLAYAWYWHVSKNIACADCGARPDNTVMVIDHVS